MIIGKRKNNKRIAGAVIIIALVLGILAYVAYGFVKPSTGNTYGVGVKITPAAAPKHEPVYGLPVRLMIPKLDVDAAIKYMGVTKTGDMAVPDNIADVGWYKHGPHPGNKGSAV